MMRREFFCKNIIIFYIFHYIFFNFAVNLTRIIMTITVIVAIVGVALYLVVLYQLTQWVHIKTASARQNRTQEELYRDCLSAKQYIGEEHEWTPQYHLEHKGMKVFNLPFVPEPNEVFYLENEYDEEANLFVQENIDLIKDVLESKGLTFVYLPSIRVTKEMAESMLAYYTANPESRISNRNYEKGLSSDFLLDYMVYPENRCKITHGFCWYNMSIELFKFKKVWHVFDYISFDATEARMHPREVLEDMLPELGTRRIWRKGVHSEYKIPSDGFADDRFDEETKKLLTEVQERLNTVRLKGISEAIIAQYVKPCPKLSRITISNSFKITLNDYNDTEITMEPIVKAVFLLFLRHEEGILFKNLVDYQEELEVIYRAVKSKKNDIDVKIKSGFTPQVCDSVKSLTDPFSNSINEKCTRIKEAFLVHFHESIAANYYIQGAKASEKVITVPRKLVVWED